MCCKPIKIITALIILLASCVSVGVSLANQSAPTDAAPAQGLQDRVRAFWQARAVGDMITAYQYEAYKATHKRSLQVYVRKAGQVAYRRADVIDVRELESDQALAIVEVETIIQGLPSPLTTRFNDRWIKIEGEWYHASKHDRLKN